MRSQSGVFDRYVPAPSTLKTGINRPCAMWSKISCSRMGGGHQSYQKNPPLRQTKKKKRQTYHTRRGNFNVLAYGPFTSDVEAFLKKTAIAYHQNLAVFLRFGRYAIEVFFKKTLWHREYSSYGIWKLWKREMRRCVTILLLSTYATGNDRRVLCKRVSLFCTKA